MLFFFFFFMEHNRLAEEGYYLAIPSGRTKNFILSEREPFPTPLSLFRPRLSCSFSFSCPFLLSHVHRRTARSGATQPDVSLSLPPPLPRHPPRFLPFIPPRELRGAAAPSFAGVPRQQSKIKIQKSKGGKNRRKLDKSRPASAFFAHLPLPPRPFAPLLFSSAVKRDRADSRRTADSFRAFNARIADSRDSFRLR